MLLEKITADRCSVHSLHLSLSAAFANPLLHDSILYHCPRRSQQLLFLSLLAYSLAFYFGNIFVEMPVDLASQLSIFQEEVGENEYPPPLVQADPLIAASDPSPPSLLLALQPSGLFFLPQPTNKQISALTPPSLLALPWFSFFLYLQTSHPHHGVCFFSLPVY